MSVLRCEVGLVSRDENLVRFYRDVFGLGDLGSADTPMGTIHRLGRDAVMIKIAVPNQTPQASSRSSAFGEVGLGYLAIWTAEDLDGVIGRVRDFAGGEVIREPFELRPGVWTSLVTDPDGNTIEVMREST
ncbi:VOC family protein [Enemella sp. A6]|uniref:VOC family protein n=1 Tax=Enemella sp. A6 TaxID=3440152 RepID=UPI003EBF78A2